MFLEILICSCLLITIRTRMFNTSMHRLYMVFETSRQGVLCSSPGWNIEYFFKFNCFQNLNMAFFYNFLKTTTFACKGCDTTCEGVYQLMIHYEYSHGVNHGCTHSTAMVPGCRDGDTKRGDVGLIKVKKTS